MRNKKSTKHPKSGSRSFTPASSHFHPKSKKHGKKNRPDSTGRNSRPDQSHPRDRGRGRHHPHAHAHTHKAETLKATVDKNRRGFGFLIFDNRKREDLFVPPREAERLFHGDRVEVTIGPRREHKIRVLERRLSEVVGRYLPHPTSLKGQGGWVIYEKKRAREEIYAPKTHLKIKPSEWVKAKIHFHEKGPYPFTAEIREVYGKDLPASMDVEMVAAEYNLTESHTASAEEEARSKRLEVSQGSLSGDLKNRRDLRNLPFITIDGETARDFDDAIYVERKASGHVLWVAIADVSHYVTEGSALNQEAKSRGTSVYFPERAFHMLPSALSENLCSLKPNEPRLAMVARMEFDRNAKLDKTEVMEAVIESKRRATYNQIQAEWEQNKKNPNWEYAPHLSLFEALRKMRIDRGSIDFELPEAEVVVDKSGEVVSLKNRSRLAAHRLIEEFMIAANEAVTEWMMEKSWPFVYRIHEVPEQDSLKKFQNLAATVGFKVALDQSSSPKIMADLIRKLNGHPAESLLNMALLRSMKQAIYSSTHGIHYGLASDAYTHFTSPIRRYPDLVVHRLLKMALNQRKPLKPKQREELEEALAEICEHCSHRERLATDAEREALKIKQVRTMMTRLGEEFDSKIVGMTEAGFFVRIENPYVEGLVSEELLQDDLYEFNSDQMIFVGRRKKRVFKIGDSIRVKVIRTDFDRRQIDFSLV